MLSKFIKNHQKFLLLIMTGFLTGVLTISPLGVEVVHANVWSFLGDLGSDVADATFGNVFRFVAWIFFVMSSGIVSVGAEFLDQAIAFSLDTSHLRNISGIRIGWEIFRDLANMTFIFILLYIAIMTILQIGDFQTKRILSNLIIVALLVNFSFFFTGVVIDTGNILGGFIYKTMTPVIGSVDHQGFPDHGDPIRATIGGTMIEGLNLSTLQEEGKLDKITNTQKGIIHFFGSIFLLIAGFVFLSGAFLFVLRTVVLILALVLSPLAFVALILPMTKKYWNSWVGYLMSNTFVAPLYLLLISVVVAIIKTDSTSGGLFAETGAKSGESLNQALLISSPGYVFSETSGIILNYVILIGLLIASLTVSKNIAGGIASASIKYAGKLTGGAAGTAGFVGRQTMGRGLRRLRDSDAVGQGMASESRAVRMGARLVHTVSDRGAKARWDARSGAVGKTIGGTAGAALSAGGVKPKVGKAGGEGGHEGERNRRIIRTEKRVIQHGKIASDAAVRHQTSLGNLAGAASHGESARERTFKDLEKRTPLSFVTGTTESNIAAADRARKRSNKEEVDPLDEGRESDFAKIQRELQEVRDNQKEKET